MKLVRFFSMALVAITLCMVSCSGEDGADGANGTNGTDGTNGTNGTNGADGEDGLGFDELTKFGYLTMVTEGTRTDNVAFKDSTSFRFTPVDGFEIDDFNQLVIDDSDPDEIQHTFSIERFLSAPDNVYQESTLRFDLTVSNLGGENSAVTTALLTIDNYAIIGEDNKYFIQEGTYSTIAFNSPLDVSDVNFDPETNRLTFEYSVDVAENNIDNDTGNPMTITGNADVFVLQEVQEQ